MWSWSPMPCEKHGPWASVTTKTSGFVYWVPRAMFFYTAWETMIKSYISCHTGLCYNGTQMYYVGLYNWEIQLYSVYSRLELKRNWPDLKLTKHPITCSAALAGKMWGLLSVSCWKMAAKYQPKMAAKYQATIRLHPDCISSYSAVLW